VICDMYVKVIFYLGKDGEEGLSNHKHLGFREQSIGYVLYYHVFPLKDYVKSTAYNITTSIILLQDLC